MNVLTEEHRPNKTNSTSKPIELIELIKPIEPIKGRTYDRQSLHKGTMVNSLRRS